MWTFKKYNIFSSYAFNLFIYFKYSSFKDYLRAFGVLENLIPVDLEFTGSLMVFSCLLITQ